VAHSTVCVKAVCWPIAEAHPEHGEANAHFVIVTVEDLNVKDAKRLLTEQGAKHVHEVLEPESER